MGTSHRVLSIVKEPQKSIPPVFEVCIRGETIFGPAEFLPPAIDQKNLSGYNKNRGKK
jgi:hypothetical protein